MIKRHAFVCLFALSSLFAQTDTGSLSGLVTDPSGAAVQGASVTLRNERSGAVRTMRSGAEGRYQFALLPPGRYELSVEADGFRTFTASGLQVQVAQPSTLDIPLTLGSTAESVQVDASVSLLTTESVSQGTIVTQEKIVSLPLNGRQFIDLALLVPGANAGGRNVQQNNVRLNSRGGFSSSGGRTNNNVFLLDGAVNSDPDYNALSYSPIVDSIAEFQVQTAQYSAQYGRASGAQINVVSKSGTNEYHGAAWEFLRNQKLDARPFNSVTANLPKNQRNQFGAVFGGPILKNKLFFFTAYEGQRLRQAGIGITNVLVPTADERRGDFSRTPGMVFDPNTMVGGVRSPFPGDRIPENRLNPISRAALDAMPLPNVGVNQFVNGNAVLKQDIDNGSVRSDWVISERMTLFGRYSLSNENSLIPDVVTDRDRLGFARPQNVAVGLTTVVAADRVNEFRAGFNRLAFSDGLPEPLFNVSGQQREIPRFRPAGYPAMGGAGAFTGTTGGGTVNTWNSTYQIYDNFSWIRGRHSIKFGGELMRINYVRSESASALGDFQFLTGYTSRTASNDGTGNALATMLLALPNQGNRQVAPTRIDGEQWSTGFYFQDDIRVNRKLTLNLGLRYEVATPLYDTRKQMSSIDYRNVPWPTQIFAEGPLAFYRPILFQCGMGAYPKGCSYMDKNNWAPRVGIAFSLDPKTVIRAGGGIFYALTDFNGLLQLTRGAPSNIGQNLNAPNNFIPSFTGFDIFGSSAEVGREALSQAGVDLFQRTSYSPQVSFSVQRELRRDIVVEAGYLFTGGVKLQQNVQPNNSQPGPGAVNPRRPYAGVVFDRAMVFPSYINVVADGAPVTQVNFYALSAQSNYHALLMRFEKRFTQGFSLLTSYTWSKAITNAPQFRNAGGANGSENSPPQDSYNLRGERGLAAYDNRHRLVNTLVWDLPFGPGQAFATSGVPAAILGGWQISGIVAAQTGFPFTINLTGDTAGIGGGTGAILVRANAVPGRASKLDGSDRTTARWFNTDAFSLTPAFQFGNVGRNTVIGPGLVNVDTVVARSFTITERFRLQVRGEFFNLANTPNYGIVGRLINVPATFGRVLNQLDPRQIQFAAKLTF